MVVRWRDFHSSCVIRGRVIPCPASNLQAVSDFDEHISLSRTPEPVAELLDALTLRYLEQAIDPMREDAILIAGENARYRCRGAVEQIGANADEV